MTKKTNQNRRLRKGPLVLLFVLAVSLLLYNFFVIFSPFLTIKASPETKRIAQSICKENSFIGFLLKNTVQNIPQNKVFQEKDIHGSLQKDSFLSWTLEFYEPSSFFYIQLNDYIYPCSKNCSILSIPTISGSIPTEESSPLFYITIQSNTNENKASMTDSKQQDSFLTLYEHKVRPFVYYLIHSPSHLGPLVGSISYSSEEGLSFEKETKFDHPIRYIIGFNSDYDEVENKINRIEQYLCESDHLYEYNTVDLRFFEQAVCSKVNSTNSETDKDTEADVETLSSDQIDRSAEEENP